MKKVPDPKDLFTDIKCQFNPKRTHRFLWSAEWDATLPTLAMCALNPSTADEEVGDPTINRMVVRARLGGFGRFMMVNGGAYRSTDPKALYDLPRGIAIGEGNDDAIRSVATRVASDGGMFICGWGVHLEKCLPGRADEVLAILKACGVQPMAYKVTKAGHPSHPLYLAYNLRPVPYPAPAEA